MNKEKEKDPVITKLDPSTNENLYIEEILKDWDGSLYGGIYGGIKWDHKKKKWIKSKI